MKRQRGFTLLEALVAFVIVALALPVLLQGGADGLRAVAAAGRTEEALARAQSHLAAFGELDHPAAEDLEGDEGNGFHWRLHVAPVASVVAAGEKGRPGASTTLYDVTATISWAAGPWRPQVQLATQRLTPTPPGSQS